MGPARGERLIARGLVRRAGRTLTVCAADVYALDVHGETSVATMLATIMALAERSD